MELLEKTIRSISPLDATARANARARLDQLAIPHWALGRLMDLAEELAGMTGSIKPPAARKRIMVMAADHGVAAAGVSKYPQEVTPQMVYNFVNGGASINVLARQAGAEVIVVDMGVAADLSELAESGKISSRRIAPGTHNMAVGPAMGREEAVRAVEAGIELAAQLADETDLFGTGDMGIGNTTPSSAIVATFCKVPVSEVTGRGTGLDDAALENKIAIIEKALKVNKPDPEDALDVLAKVGGFEIGGIAGVILGAAAAKKPVVVDGFISTAGALVAYHLAPFCSQYMIAGHKSVEQGHRIALEHLGKEALLDLNLRLGEGTGGAVAMNLVDAAVRILTEVFTFAEAGVAGPTA